MSKIAIIGGGISGLSMANLLQKSNHVTVFERDSKPGGLIKCEVVNGNLYHTVGGHVFNSKRKDVLNWFWSFLIVKRTLFLLFVMPPFQCLSMEILAIR